MSSTSLSVISSTTTYFDLLTRDLLYFIIYNYMNPRQILAVCDLSAHTARICDHPELKLYKRLISEKLKLPLLDESAISNKDLYAKYVEGGQAHSYGYGKHGKLGHGNNADKATPIPIKYFKAHNIKIIQISAGHDHSLFLDNKGQVYSCGHGMFGQLGHGDNFNKLYPKRIRYFLKHGIKITNIAAGRHDHSLFLDNNGRTYSCGYGVDGQLGRDNTKTNSNPMVIPYFTEHGIKIVNIFAGSDHSLFLTDNGHIYSCGSNRNGRSGHGNDANKKKPTLIYYFIENSIKIVNISASTSYTIFLDDMGRVYNCGCNVYKQLGHGDSITNILQPTIMSYFTDHDIKIVNMAAGNSHALFLDTNGCIYSCGNGSNGQLGHGDDVSRSVPTNIHYFTDNNIKIINMVTGNSYSLFLDSIGRIHSCGYREEPHHARSNPLHFRLIQNMPVIIDMKIGGEHSLFLV